MDLNKKREKEKRIIKLMIHLYTSKHDDINEQELVDYACLKIDRCPRIEEKTFCSKCPIHCYQKEKREQIRKVMKYSGPRLFIFHPILVIKHYILDNYF